MMTMAILCLRKYDISNDIINSINKGKTIIYSKWFWKWIMFFIKLIPESIFKKLNL